MKIKFPLLLLKGDTMLIIYKNRKSGKHFILINEIDTDTGLFITPEGRVIELSFKLFQEDSFEDDEKNLLDNGIVTLEQVIKYEQYKENRDDEDIEEKVYIIVEFAQQDRKFLNDLLCTIDEMEKENKNNKFLIKLRERILEEL